MHVFDVLGDPVRRRILELMATGERRTGDIVDVVRAEYGISQPAVSQHLQVLRTAGFASVRAEGRSRYYSLNKDPFLEVDVWLKQFRLFWENSLDALEQELERSRKEQNKQEASEGSAGKS